jgi:hypothetical protein
VSPVSEEIERTGGQFANMGCSKNLTFGLRVDLWDFVVGCKEEA